MQRLSAVLMALLCACSLSACGSKSDKEASQKQSSPTGSYDTTRVEKTAEDVAKAERGNVDCPATVKTPGKQPGEPVDDVVGIRPGMTYDEATNTAMCTNPLLVAKVDDSRQFKIKTYGMKIRNGFSATFAKPQVIKSQRDEMRDYIRGTKGYNENALKPGQSEWYVGTMGIPGEERVMLVSRREMFPEGKQPTVEAITKALKEKYGSAPSLQKTEPRGALLEWIYDPLGRPVTETSPLYKNCPAADIGSLNPDCGLVVKAFIEVPESNHELAEYLDVNVVNHAKSIQMLDETEHKLAELDSTRRAKELKDANGNAAKPTL